MSTAHTLHSPSPECGASMVMAAILAPLAILIILGSIEFAYYMFSKNQTDFLLRSANNRASQSQAVLQDTTNTTRAVAGQNFLPSTCIVDPTMPGSVEDFARCRFLDELRVELQSEGRGFQLLNGPFLAVTDVGERRAIAIEADFVYERLIAIPFFGSSSTIPFRTIALAEESRTAPEPHLYDCFGRRAGTVSIQTIANEPETPCPCSEDPTDMTRMQGSAGCACRAGFVPPQLTGGSCLCERVGSIVRYNEPGYYTCECPECPTGWRKTSSGPCGCECTDSAMEGPNCDCPQGSVFDVENQQCQCADACPSVGHPATRQSNPANGCGCSCPDGFDYDAEGNPTCVCPLLQAECHVEGKRLVRQTTGSSPRCACVGCESTTSHGHTFTSTINTSNNTCDCNVQYPNGFPLNVRVFSDPHGSGCNSMDCGPIRVRNAQNGCVCDYDNLLNRPTVENTPQKYCHHRNRVFDTNCSCGEHCGSKREVVDNACVCNSDNQPPPGNCGAHKEWDNVQCSCRCNLNNPHESCSVINSGNPNPLDCTCSCPTGQAPRAIPGGGYACARLFCNNPGVTCVWQDGEWIVME